MNDLTKSQLFRAEELTKKYKELLDDIQVHENYLQVIKTELIELLEKTDEKKINGVRLVENIKTRNVIWAEVRKLFLFNDYDNSQNDLLDYVVVNVDIERTIEYLQLFKGMQNILAKKVGEKLTDLQEIKFKDLKVGK